MARIAVLAAGIIAGVAIGWATSNPMLGFAVFSTISSIGMALLPTHLNVQPPLNDLQVMSSAPGSPIPYGFGGYRVAGQVIWAETIQVTKYNQSTGGSAGGPSTAVFVYTVSAAISFGYGPGTITRIWADAKLVYDVTGKGPIAVSTGLANSKGVAYTSPFEPTIYNGTSTQNPDPTIQADQGVNATPAYRNQIYMVLKNFYLADFGNRLPSFRAEITASVGESYVADTFPESSLPSNYAGNIQNPTFTYVDPVNRFAYTLNATGDVIQKIDLDATTGIPADPYQVSTFYAYGDQIIDPNGNIQMCLREAGFTSPSASHSPAQGFETGYGDVTDEVSTDTRTWQNLGVGPDVIPIVAQKQLLAASANVPFNSINAGMVSGADTGGNFWVQGAESGNFSLYRWSSIQGTSINTIQSNANVGPIPYGSTTGPLYWGSLTFIKSALTGTNYIVALGHYYNFIGVYNADTAALVAMINYAPFVPAGGYNVPTGPNSGIVAPVVDPNTGNVYVLMTNADGDAQIIVINGIGSGTYLRTLNVGQAWQYTNNSDIPSALLFDVNDNTLIMLSSLGSVVKISSTSGTVLSYIHQAVNGSSNYAPMWAKAYNCICPLDDVLKVESYALDGNNFPQFAYINVSELAVEQLVSISQWIPAGGGGRINWGGYDVLTNSMLVWWASGLGAATVRIYFDRQTVAETPLADIISTLWANAGGAAGDLDVSQVEEIMVTGYPITQTQTAKASITPLCQAYFFEMVESNNKLIAVPRGQSVSTVIPEGDLGLTPDNYEAIPKIMQENDLPLSMSVNYFDPALDYQQGKQFYKRNAKVKKTRNESIISLPLTLTADQAASIAARGLATVWAERNQWTTKVWRASYLVIDPTDVVQFTYNGNVYQARVIKTSIGQNNIIELTAVSEDPRQYAVVLAGNKSTGFRSGSIVALAGSTLYVMDIPLVQDIDASPTGVSGYYWGVDPTSTSASWPGATLYLSTDGNTFNPIASQFTAAIFGILTNVLAAPTTLYTWDWTSVINVQMNGSYALTSDTEVNVMNGSNWLWLNGEILAFQSAVLQSDGSYNLTGLMRGLRGTEGYCGSHVPNETMVMLSQNQGIIAHSQAASAYNGLALQFRGITVGNPVTGTASQLVNFQANDLKPYAPAQLTGYVDISQNIVMSWVRRTRIGGQWQGSTDTVPISEQAELYNVFIYDSTGQTLKRSVLGLNTPTFTYTLAQQTADFGSAQSSVYVVVYQVSATVGNGFPATNPALGSGEVVSGGSNATQILGNDIVGTAADGDIMQFNGTTGQWDIIGPLLKRQTITKSTASLGNGSVETGTLVTGCRSFILLDVSVSVASRVELYQTSAFQSSDSGRAYGTAPATGGQNGIVCDIGLMTGGPESWVCSPPLSGANMDSPTAQQVYYAITNNSGGTSVVTVTFTIIPLEY